MVDRDTGPRPPGGEASGPSGGANGASSSGVGSGWALSLGSWFGIPVRLHFTFLLFLLWIGWAASGRGSQPWVEVLFLLALFLCVLLHELGHSLAARRFGVRTREIVLYPIGGVARLDGMPHGRAELTIALAGPAVNVLIALGLGAAMWSGGLPWPTSPEEIVAGSGLVPRLLAANVLLVAFNLIPAFPMDGGRALRAFLTFFLAPARATAIAAAIGQGFAILFGAAGLFTGNFILVFIALFVFLGAGQEASYERGRSALSGRVARDAMITRFEVLRPQDTLEQAARLLIDTHQQDFPVLDAWGRVAGVLSRSVLLAGLARVGPQGAVLEVMERDVATVDPGLALERVLAALQARPSCPVLIADENGLVGMITLENLLEVIEISRRLGQREERKGRDRTAER